MNTPFGAPSMPTLDELLELTEKGKAKRERRLNGKSRKSNNDCIAAMRKAAKMGENHCACDTPLSQAFIAQIQSTPGFGIELVDHSDECAPFYRINWQK
jgi:hypothetical protein